MKKIISFIAVICILSLLLATESLAQSERKWEGNKRWEAKRQSSRRRYDPKTVETIRGEVISVDKISSRQGILYLIMKTDKGAIDVQLGPAWYMEKQNIKIEPKDKIEVRGSRITFEETPTIITAEIRKGDKILELRNKNGFPKWIKNRRQGAKGQYGTGYDPKTVETISGEVVSVDKITPREGEFHLMVKTGKETISVHVGPVRYMEKQKIKIEPKDKIEVRGSRITFEGKPTILTAEIKKGDKILKLRNKNGSPVWGWRRR